MTREEVKAWLKHLKDDAHETADSIVPSDIEIALGIAIEALEQPEKGHWIDIDSQLYTWKARCDRCGHERSMMSTQGKYPKFCEGCGAEMMIGR